VCLSQFLQKDKTRGAVPRVMQQEKGQLQGGLRYLGQLFKQLQVIAPLIFTHPSLLLIMTHFCPHCYCM